MIYTFKLPDKSDKIWFFKPAAKWNYFVWMESTKYLFYTNKFTEIDIKTYSLAKSEELAELITRIWQAKKIGRTTQ
jgi:hypothetical protein